MGVQALAYVGVLEITLLAINHGLRRAGGPRGGLQRRLARISDIDRLQIR